MGEVDAELAQRLELTADGRPRRGRRRRIWIVAGVVLVAVAAGIAALVARPTPTTWETAQVTRGRLESTVTAVGRVEPLHVVDIGSEASGIVRDVLVETGERVSAGQVLAELDADLVRAQVAQARANVGVAKASVAQAEAAAAEADASYRRVAQVDGLAEELVERARFGAAGAHAALEAAEAQLAAARAGLRVAEETLERTVLVTPIDGVVLERHVEPGQAVVSALQAATLFRVAESLDRMVVRVEVDEADVGEVHEGQDATFTVAAWPARVFEARTVKVEPAPRGVGQVVSYEAELEVDNADGALRPGMTATASIVCGVHDDHLLVPTAALRWEPDDAAPGDGARVWVPEGESVRAVDVQRVASDGRRVAIGTAGLSEGDLVVIGELAAP